jgi:hypothetical protein
MMALDVTGTGAKEKTQNHVGSHGVILCAQAWPLTNHAL